eukprot:167311_1
MAMRRSKIVRKQINYNEESLSPPRSAPIRVKTGKEFVLPTPFISSDGALVKAGHKFKITRSQKLKYKILQILKYAVVDEQKQIHVVSFTHRGISPDIILLQNCKLWDWLPAAIPFSEEITKIGFCEMELFVQLEYKNYKTLYNVGQRLYFQPQYHDATNTPKTISCIIEQTDPDTHAAQNGREYKIRLTGQKTRKGHKLNKYIWVSEFELDENSESWKINDLSIELQIGRKAAKFHNKYFIENHMTLTNAPDDLNYFSPFWRKPSKYESFKNIAITGFNNIYEKDSIFNLLEYAIKSHCNVKQFKGYYINININNISNRMYRFGKHENEYVMQYAMVKYLLGIGVTQTFSDAYISFNMTTNTVKDEFPSLISITANNGTVFELSTLEQGNTAIILKYHRENSILFVHKARMKIKNRKFVKKTR